MIAVLFTGSRYAKPDYPEHKRIIWNALRQIAGPEPVTLYEGEADGADTIARQYAEFLGWTISKHPADWTGACVAECPAGHRKHYRKPAANRGRTYCPDAGPRRNQEMVDAVCGAHATRAVCVGTPMGEYSAGTFDCMRRAKKAGIEVLPPFNLPPVPPKNPRTKPQGVRA